MGWNLTLIVQFAPGPRLLGQLFVCWNGLATLMWLIFRTPAPEFVSVTCCAGLVVKTTWFGKVRLVGENVTDGNTPTPVSETDWGLRGALSVTLTAAFRVPVVLGLKVTLIWQLLFGGSDEGQLFFSPKSPLFVPVIWIDVMVSLIFPVF